MEDKKYLLSCGLKTTTDVRAEQTSNLSATSSAKCFS